MFSKAFSNPSKANWIIQGAGAVWFLGVFLLLSFYGVEITIASMDAFAFALVFYLGVVALDKVFGFYIPKGGNTFLLLLIPVVLSFLGVYVHQIALNLFLVDNLEYGQVLKAHFYLRWMVLALAEILISLIAIVVAKLEQQEELNKREVMMSELSREAELTQLRQQLQPHFLFNSLNSISALVIAEPKKARTMVLQLSDFLRGTIRKDPHQWVTVEEEVNYLKMYLEIERVRFGHRMEVDLQLEEEAKEMSLPQLVIQPLLENAIKHGLYGMTGEVKISLSIKRSQNYLLINLTNPYDPQMAPPKGTGFGLSSIERRLFLIFGRKDLLDTDSSDSLFTVNLKIPQLK